LKHLVKILDQAEAKQDIGCTFKAALEKNHMYCGWRYCDFDVPLQRALRHWPLPVVLGVIGVCKMQMYSLTSIESMAYLGLICIMALYDTH
jgi:hypothetical protein